MRNDRRCMIHGGLTARTAVPAPRECPRVSVVLSFWNESDVLPELIARLRGVLSAERQKGAIASHELIFVNDASTDDSEAVIRAHAEGTDDIRIINMSRNFGVSPCVLAGMEHATGDVVVYMDADLQDPPEVIPELIAAWRSEPDAEVVHTIRSRRDGETRFKLMITRLGYLILKSISTIELPIEAGDFKLISRRARDELIRFREKRPYLRGLVCWIGFKQLRVKYVRDPRFAGETKFPVLSRQAIRNFLDSAMIAFSDVPLKLSIFAGMCITASTFVYIAWILGRWLGGEAISAWSAVLIAVLFLGGINLVSIGILGLYIGSMFLEAKHRPNYIVKDAFGFPPDESRPMPVAEVPAPIFSTSSATMEMSE